MVFAANGATVVDGRVLGARFATPERAARGAGLPRLVPRPTASRRSTSPEHVNEGEGDFAVTGRLRSWPGRASAASPLSHDEAQEFFGRPVIGLELVDPRYYHLDTALSVLDDAATRSCTTRAPSRPAAAPCWPGSSRTRCSPPRRTRRRSASTRSATAATCCCRRRPPACREPLRDRGFEPIGIDLCELLKGGGSVKCCTLELREPAA